MIQTRRIPNRDYLELIVMVEYFEKIILELKRTARGDKYLVSNPYDF